MAPPHGAVGWSAVCGCGILLSHSLTFRPDVQEEMSFKDISFFTLVAILLSGSEPFVQFWKMTL